MKKDILKIDKEFLMGVLSHVDALTKRVEELEKLKVKIDFNDFKVMLKQANDEAMKQILDQNPTLKTIFHG